MIDIRPLILILIFFAIRVGHSQNCDYWQQKIDYTMKIDMDVATNTYKGFQHLIYHNNSPDTIRKVYYHLYYNAFQNGSMMDVRARTIFDPSMNMDSTIHNLAENEIGYEKVNVLKQCGKAIDYEVIGTILKADLTMPILPGDSTCLDMIYEVQIPIMCRRAGRDSKQGIDYSMAQWYPKLAEYDKSGWHPDPYIAREFYGVWGDYDVVIDLDSRYILAAGAEQINSWNLGNGKTRWSLRASNVHDFVWAADRDYKFFSLQANDKTKFNYYYQDIGKRDSIWHEFAPIMVEAFKFMNKRYGEYQYPVYNFIEGGDGGMEYPLATLITGSRSLNSLVGVSSHEFMHSWYQMQLATNESLYPWMDEGFTSFATIEVLKYLTEKGLINRNFGDFPFERDYKSYVKYMMSRFYEPMNIHSDHYNTNYAYSRVAYTGGLIFLKQLEYIVGKDAFDKGLLTYFNKWKFKHPTPTDFIRVMEKVSDIELDWYLQDFISSGKYIDFAIDSVYSDMGNTVLEINRKGSLHMPVDIEVELKDGKKYYYNIPRTIMYGSKKNDIFEYEVLKPWAWVEKKYKLVMDFDIDKIKTINLDASLRMLDVNREDNIWSQDATDH